MYEEKTKKRIEELSKNIGKRCKIIQSEVVHIAQKPATIINVVGKWPDGFRYEVKLDEPIPLWGNKDTFYPPVFFVEIIE